MGKLQPNFSWQKYEGKPEDQKTQFQYQLQSQHIQVANSVNTVIDDESFWNTERQTSFIWIDSKAIWTKTITGTVVGTADTAYPLGVTGILQVISIQGAMQNAGAFTDAEPLPYLDPTALAAGVGIYVQGTDLHINAGNGDFNGYGFAVTIEYTK